MSSAAAIGAVEDKLRWMVKKEMRGPGDAGSALERLIDRYKMPAAAVRAVLYRKPADIYLSVFLSISEAYQAEVDRWEKAFEHERAIARAKTGLGTTLLRLADTLDGTQAPALTGEDHEARL